MVSCRISLAADWKSQFDFCQRIQYMTWRVTSTVCYVFLVSGFETSRSVSVRFHAVGTSAVMSHNSPNKHHQVLVGMPRIGLLDSKGPVWRGGMVRWSLIGLICRPRSPAYLYSSLGAAWRSLPRFLRVVFVLDGSGEKGGRRQTLRGDMSGPCQWLLLLDCLRNKMTELKNTSYRTFIKLQLSAHIH